VTRFIGFVAADRMNAITDNADRMNAVTTNVDLVDAVTTSAARWFRRNNV
jgi:hypothetical protein